MTQVKAENRQHLVSLVEEHLKKHGYSCDLNHIDVSQITDLSFFFSESIFNGDISQWDVSNVLSVERAFYSKAFLQDISTLPFRYHLRTNQMFDLARNSEVLERQTCMPHWLITFCVENETFPSTSVEKIIFDESWQLRESLDLTTKQSVDYIVNARQSKVSPTIDSLGDLCVNAS